MKYWISLVTTMEVDQYVEIARFAEQVGFEGVTVPDHPGGPHRGGDALSLHSRRHQVMTLPWTPSPWERAPWVKEDEDHTTLSVKCQARERFARQFGLH